MKKTLLELTKQELDKSGVFNKEINKTAQMLMDTVGADVPDSMKKTIANYTMTSFINHFQYKIKLTGKNKVPINSISFVLAKSGANKTSGVITMEKALQGGYDVIQDYRDELAQNYADENDEDFKSPPPLSNTIGTEAGIIQRINDFKKDGIGMPSLFVDEIATELASNPDIVSNITLISQLFDNGDAKSKPLKDRTQQSEEIKGMGQTGLFIGSEAGILDDPLVSKKFKIEFLSKLARRVFFCYPIFSDIEPIFDSLEEYLIIESIAEEQINRNIDVVSKMSAKLAKVLLSKEVREIELSKDTKKLYVVYKGYCNSISKNISDESLQIEQKHRHWKALKLAGVYALFNNHRQIEIQDLTEAINVAEETGESLGRFLEKTNRKTYEVMSDYMQVHTRLSIHEMVKLGWIKKEKDLDELLELANSKDKGLGIFVKEEGVVEYTAFIRTEGVGVSYLSVSGTKQERGFKSHEGYKYVRRDFKELDKVLCNDTSYCPFEFKGGHRKHENIIGGADFVILDIDDSDVTYEEAHDMLEDYTHLIAMTSTENPFKFRVLIPTDVSVDVPRNKWKQFMSRIQDHLGLNIDLLPKSQMYYGFKGREVIYNEGEDLEASEFMKNLDEPVEKIKRVTTENAISKVWDSRLTTFNQAYDGEGSGLNLRLFGAMKDGFKVGFSKQMNIDLIEDILDYIDDEPTDVFLKSLDVQRDRLYKD